MILRKPFAFLIKHFKLIHFILFGFMCYIMYSSSSILSFYSEYLSSTLVLIDHEVVTTLYSVGLTVSFVFVFAITVIVMGLMLMKQKPVKFYIFNLIVYIATLVVLMLSKNLLGTLEIELVEVRTIKLIQDFVVMTVFIQGVMCIATVTRATGFNVKKFDFVKDLAELDIEEEDSEEFEVSVELESDRYLRKFRRIIRYIKYIYLENKYLFSIIGAVLVAVICFVVYLNLTVYNKVYKENDTYTTNEFYFSIADSYITKQDYKGNVIDEQYSFVIAKIKLRSVSAIERILSVGRVALHVNDRNIYHTTDYKTEFSDLGYFYNGEELTNQFSEYILVFKIPDSYVDDAMMIYYFDTNLKTIKTRINPENLDNNIVENSYSVGTGVSMENSILKNSNITIENSEIAPSFKMSYQFCVSTNECNTSYEHIKPLLNTKVDKALIQIKGNYSMDETLVIHKPQKLYSFIEKFGSIIYTLNGQNYMISDITEIIPTKIRDNNTIYLEVPNTVLQAESVKLKIKVRNQSYFYILK